MMEFWLKFLNVASMFIIPVLFIFVIFLIGYIIYQNYKIKKIKSLMKQSDCLHLWKKALDGRRKEIIYFHNLCKIFNNYLIRELEEKITEAETKELSKFIQELLKNTEENIEDLEEEI